MNGWPLVTLDEIFDICRGGSPRPIDAYLTSDPDGVNWIMISDASEGSKYITHTKKRIRREGAQRSREVKPGDFVLTNSMSFGRPYIMRTSGCIHDGWLVLSPRSKDADPDFFYHLLSSKSLYSEFERRAAGATVKNLNIDLVKGVKVPLPPVEEQRRIADILDKADALRGRRRTALAQLDVLTESIFLDLFGDPGSNSKRWPISKLGDVSEVQGGLQVSPARNGNPKEVPYLRVANVFRGYLDLKEVKTLKATDPEITRTHLKKDDFLIVEGHGNPEEIGRGALWDGSIPNCVHQNHLIRVRFSTEMILPLFASEYLNSRSGRRHLLRSGKTTSGLNTISTSEVKATPIALPPIELQAIFGQRLTSAKQLEVIQDSSLAEFDALFLSIQNRAFRGEL